MKITDLKPNESNPRFIRDDRFEKLVKSINEFPKMMKLRPIITDGEGVILGGNMRYKALVEIGYKEIPDEWVKVASELTEDEKKRFVVSDNTSFGDWDFDLLQADFDVDLLKDWGLEVPSFDDVSLEDLSLKENAFSEAANQLSFSITFNFPISEKDIFDKFDKKELETVLIDFVHA